MTSDVRLRTVAVLVFAALAPLVPGSATARAGDAVGCSGTAASYGPDGGLLDAVAAPGDGGTQQDPFDIFRDGSVQYQGQTDQTIRNGRWSVDLGGTLGLLATVFEIASGKNLLSGAIGDDPERSRSGEFAANDYASKISGLQVVTVQLTGEAGARCTATVWVRVHGDFWDSLVAIAGSFILLLGFLLLVVGAPQWAAENVAFRIAEDIAERGPVTGPDAGGASR